MTRADEYTVQWRNFSGPVLIILMATSTVVLVVLSVTKVKESLYGINLIQTTCTVKLVYVGPEIMCECPQQACPYEDTRACQCFSTYPCTLIDVEYTTKESNNVSAVLYATEKEIFAMSRCSVTYCSTSAKKNKAFVTRFIKENSIRAGSKISCFYENNVQLQGQVLIRTTFDRSEAKVILIHGLMWPSLVFVACLVGIIKISSSSNRISLNV